MREKFKQNRKLVVLVMCFFLIFAYFIIKKAPSSEPKCYKKEANIQSAVNSFFEKMREDRIEDRKKYESCNYNQECEIWVLPKINIYQLEKRMHDFMYYESITKTTVTLSGEIMNITELDISKFFNTLNAVKMETFTVDELKTKSVIHHEGSYFNLYNQEDFAIKNNMLLVDLKGLGGVNQGFRYRLDTDYLQPPRYSQESSRRRDYPLNQCSEIIGFFHFN